MIRPRPARLRYAAHVAAVLLWTALGAGLIGWAVAELTAPLIRNAAAMETPR